MKITRVFAMPSPDTFSIQPISELLDRWLWDCKTIIDPFARNSSRAHHTNDLNPETKAQYHTDAEQFMEQMAVVRLRADGFLMDPPYSPRQISECYQSIGRITTGRDTQNARIYKAVKDAADKILTIGAIAICCGWNSSGMGIGRGYELVELLLVNHGGAHNDTIVTVERKIQGTL